MKPRLPSISASEARRRLAASVRPFDQRRVPRRVPLHEAAHRMLAEPLRASLDLPPFARSAMDGFAVRAADLASAAGDAPVHLRRTGEVVMGQPATLSLQAGQAIAVATGAPLPEGADAVVMVEHVEADAAGALAFRQPIAPGKNVIGAGEDFAAGALVLPAGRRLGAREIGALAAFGVTQVAVYRRPRVAILSSGPELCRSDQEPAPGQIHDVNQPMLAAAAAACGAVVTRAGIAADDLAALTAALAELLPAHDLVLVSGGSSVGARDFTAAAFAALGARLLFHGIDIRPGRPTLAAVHADHLLVGLPGVPVAALRVFDGFVRSVIHRLAGGEEDEPIGHLPLTLAARLAHPIVSRRGREDSVGVRLEVRGEERWAVALLAGRGSLSTWLVADGVLVVDEETERLEAGALVEITPISERAGTAFWAGA